MEIKYYFDELKKIGRKTYFSRNGEEELCFSNKKFAVEIYKTVDHDLDFIISIDGVRENYQQTKALDKNQIEEIKALLIAPLSLDIKCRKISHILLSLDEKLSKISRSLNGGAKVNPLENYEKDLVKVFANMKTPHDFDNSPDKSRFIDLFSGYFSRFKKGESFSANLIKNLLNEKHLVFQTVDYSVYENAIYGNMLKMILWIMEKYSYSLEPSEPK